MDWVLWDFTVANIPNVPSKTIETLVRDGCWVLYPERRCSFFYLTKKPKAIFIKWAKGTELVIEKEKIEYILMVLMPEKGVCAGERRGIPLSTVFPGQWNPSQVMSVALSLCVLLDHAKCFIRQTLLILVSFLLDRKTKTSKQTWFRGGKDLPDWPFQVTVYCWEKSGQELK